MITLPAYATAATVLSSALVHAVVSPDTELLSEATCWALLALASRLIPSSLGDVPSQGKQPQLPVTRRGAIARLGLLQKIAIGAVVIASLGGAVTNTRWVSPLLIPAVVGMRLYSAGGSQFLDAGVRGQRQHEIYRQLLIAAPCLGLLLWSRPPLGILDVPFVFVHGASTAALMTCLNAAAGAAAAAASSKSPPKERDGESLDAGLAGRVAGDGGGLGGDLVMSVAGVLAVVTCALAALLAMFNMVTLRGVLGVVLVGGLAKAAWWASAMQLTRTAPWEALLSIETVTLSWSYGWGAAPFIGRMALAACAGLLSVVQLHRLLPRAVLGSPRMLQALGLLATLCVLVPAPALSGKGDLSHLPLARHPIEELHAAAAENFEALLSRQSRTLAEATAEYRRRYMRDPPPGFDKWFAYAQSKESVILDDFDIIDEGLRPLWRHSAQELGDTIVEAAKWNLNVVRCGIAGGNFSVGDCGKFGRRIGELLAEVAHELPDIMFALNLLDEPSVLPLEVDSGDAESPDLWTLITGAPASEPVSAACAGRAPLRSRFPAPRSIQTHGLPFVTDIMDAKDICRHDEYAGSHGFLLSPSTFAYSRRAFPLLSRAAPHPYSDILFPSPHYVRKGEVYDTAHDIPWEAKLDGLYWAGKATGLLVTDHHHWRQGHRQRLVTLGERPPYRYLSGGGSGGGYQPSDEWSVFEAPELDTWMFRTHISELVQCSFVMCLAEARVLRPSQYLLPSDGPTEPYRYRLVLDIDGNSYSGRFYRLLGSGSLTLKATLFREWHDDRLVPWFHYVPVSVSLDELPELVRFMTRTERGRTLARDIAERGREWHGRALRAVDMTVYMYRLILELARLLDPARPLLTG